MLIRRFLFETKVGEMLLTALERYAGLAVVRVDWVASQRSRRPKAAADT